MFSTDISKFFEPCAATASMFLYAHGSAIICLQRDTLTVERRFQRHTEEVLLISVDNLSERGAGRLVVSYDAGQAAIVWDVLTGDEIARFVSYEHIRVAAWMRNGNVAFGNSQGNVILFEPSTSEHISARTIFDPITALAPAADCRTYAIGYMNGSILIAALQPSFTILHTLMTPRAPSPIVTLAWHASSSRQKSDMLATQTLDGDLRVWSVAKSTTNEDAARVVRVLSKSDGIFEPGPNWLAWSKNGRILQFSEGKTSMWDVRTKHVSYEPVSTPEVVTGLAIHGPSATLFVVSSNSNILQYNLNPPTLVANVQHPPVVAPPSPPVSVEEQKVLAQAPASAAPAVAPPQPLEHTPHDAISETGTFSSLQQSTVSEVEPMTSLQQISQEMDRLEEKRQDHSGASPVSSTYRSKSRAASISSQSSGGRRHIPSSISSKSTTLSSNDGTVMSMGSSFHSSRDSLSTGNSSPASTRSRPRGSRLRQEVMRSPEEPPPKKVDLFPYTRARLSDVPHSYPQGFSQHGMSDDDLRRQMLSVLFGWDDDIENLIRDELKRHPPGSPSMVLLSNWLGDDMDPELMTSMVSNTMTSTDWMLLALNSMGVHQKTLAQAYVKRTLAQGDIHTAAAILLGLGDHHDAVEVYVSHKFYMEAVLLACLVFRDDWGRQATLVKKWGEHAVQRSHTTLAIRCFSCLEPELIGGQWSPAGILSPPLSPPPAAGNISRIKNTSLKLITSFGEGRPWQGHSGLNPRFHGMEDDERTPMNGAGTTPIADSATSSGSLTPLTHLRSHRRGLPTSARTITPGGYPHTLPVIGETPVEATPRAAPRSAPRIPAGGQPLPTPVDSGSEKERAGWPSGLRSHDRKDSGKEEIVPITLSSARYEPTPEESSSKASIRKDPVKMAPAKSPMTEVRNKNLPSPAQGAFTALKEESRSRNGSRDRKPDGLQIQWPPMESIITGQYVSSPDLPTGRPRHRRSNTMSSISSAASSLPGHGTTKSPAVACYSAGANPSPLSTGRSTDQFISSLGEASYYAKRQRDDSRRRHGSRDDRARGAGEESKGRGRSHSRQRLKERDASENRGRSGGRYIKPAKRSPSSPVPMSPEDLKYSSTGDSYDDERYYGVVSPIVDPRKARERSGARTGGSATRSEAKVSEASRREHRRESPAPDKQSRSRGGSRGGSRATSRRHSPDTKGERVGRGRSKVRAESSVMRSPSSPLPMSPQAKLHQHSDEKGEELNTVPEERHRSRSTSRRPSERGTSAVREQSLDNRRVRDRSTSRRPRERGTSAVREPSPAYRRRRERSESRGRLLAVTDRSVLRRSKSERSLKRELAARELEERRQSLARRPSAPAIPHPIELSSGKYSSSGRVGEFADAADFYRSPVLPDDRDQIPRGHTTSPTSAGSNQTWSSGNGGNPPAGVGLPATPRAMRHPRYATTDPNELEGIPAVPEIPGNLTELPPPSVYSPQRRSMSAPIPEDPGSPAALPAALPTHPAFLHTLPPSNRRRGLSPGGEERPVRKVGPGEAQPGTLGYESRNNGPIYSGNAPSLRVGIDETMAAGKGATSPINNKINLVPPPPPPPPILPELQHLATPSASPSGPAPPPPPSKYKPQHSHTGSGGSGVGVINIGIEGGSRDHTPVTETPPSSYGYGQPGSQPGGQPGGQSGSQVGGHSRVRSINESVSSRMLAAAERLRSVSRPRGKSPYAVSPQYESSPYESVPNLPFVERVEKSPVAQVQKERHPMEVRAGYLEGGMI
ncbi:hypothetical protein FGG08_004383 [Glutinoglossum americanum]|uniref:Gem-associated protein 5 TPR domain-containing protein n=1 Tax=Glutinoglossum americanum TaxID=1670608 RepID=A0A9P8KX63_9PEZI|nr:hypothetical protein FGG08_004383 [Glutinoglossum americanum]